MKWSFRNGHTFYFVEPSSDKVGMNSKFIENFPKWYDKTYKGKFSVGIYRDFKYTKPDEYSFITTNTDCGEVEVDWAQLGQYKESVEPTEKFIAEPETPSEYCCGGTRLRSECEYHKPDPFAYDETELPF